MVHYFNNHLFVNIQNNRLYRFFALKQKFRAPKQHICQNSVVQGLLLLILGNFKVVVTILNYKGRLLKFSVLTTLSVS